MYKSRFYFSKKTGGRFNSIRQYYSCMAKSGDNRFKSTTEEVEYLLSKYPEAKNNDFYLQWVWLKDIEGLDLPEMQWRKFQQLSGKMGSIRRARQKVQSMGKHLPSDEKILQRRKRWRNIRLQERKLLEPLMSKNTTKA